MHKTFEEYLALGFDEPMARYFASGQKRTLIQVTPHRDYSLELLFDNGERRRLDILPLIQAGKVWAPLQDWEIFSRVFVDDFHALAWDIDPTIDSDKFINNRLDYCPDCCYVDSVPYA